MAINGSTRILAVLGHPIVHTASPAMHNAAFDALRLNWRYLALDVEPSCLKVALRGLAASGLAGVNLTVPHKILAMRWVDRLDPQAQRLGATNTLRFSWVGGCSRVEGFNTDGYGLQKALKEEFGFRARGRTVAIVGCGGAGRSAAIQMALDGARRLILLNRTRFKAAAVARQIRALKLKTECLFHPQPCDLVIQATSLGLKASDAMPFSAAQWRELSPKFFFEMIYSPPETAAMRLARGSGCRTANGISMLLHQGARAFEIWTGRKPPLEVMRRVLRKEIHGK